MPRCGRDPLSSPPSPSTGRHPRSVPPVLEPEAPAGGMSVTDGTAGRRASDSCPWAYPVLQGRAGAERAAGMTTFHCASCGAQLTAELQQMAWVPERPSHEGLPVDGVRRAQATMPRGFYATDPDPTGAPFVASDDQDRCVPAYPGGPSISDEGVEMISGGPRNTVLLHPEDMPGLVLLNTGEVGCCGAPGDKGPHRGCRCGALIGTEMSECYTPYELHLVPGSVVEEKSITQQ